MNIEFTVKISGWHKGQKVSFLHKFTSGLPGSYDQPMAVQYGFLGAIETAQRALEDHFDFDRDEAWKAMEAEKLREDKLRKFLGKDLN